MDAVEGRWHYDSSGVARVTTSDSPPEMFFVLSDEQGKMLGNRYTKNKMALVKLSWSSEDGLKTRLSCQIGHGSCLCSPRASFAAVP